MFWVTVRITSNSMQNEAVQTITFNIRMCVCFYEKYEKLSLNMQNTSPYQELCNYISLKPTIWV